VLAFNQMGCIVGIMDNTKIENETYKLEASEIGKRIANAASLEIAEDRANRMLSRFGGNLKIYRGGNHIALLAKRLFSGEYHRVAIFTSN
jgi:hypothetical protein